MAYVININANSAVTLNLVQGQVMLEPFQHCTIDFRDEEFAKKNYNDQKLGLYYAETEKELDLITSTYKKRNAIADETTEIQKDQDLSEDEGTETTETGDTEKEPEIIKGTQSFDSGTIYANYIPKVIVEPTEQPSDIDNSNIVAGIDATSVVSGVTSTATNAVNDIIEGTQESVLTAPNNIVDENTSNATITEFAGTDAGLDAIPDELLNDSSKSEVLEPESPTETLSATPDANELDPDKITDAINAIEFGGEAILNGLQASDPVVDTSETQAPADAEVKKVTLQNIEDHKEDLEYLKKMADSVGYKSANMHMIKAPKLYQRLKEFIQNK